MSVPKFAPLPGRLEDPPLLRGEGQFLDDIVLPGMLEAAFVRSPHPHAHFGTIDAARARALPGVHAVYTHAEILSVLTTNFIPVDNIAAKFRASTMPVVLAESEVCSVGQVVAIIVADSRYIAEDAAALVEVDYDPRPAVSDCRDALAPGAPRVHSDAPDNIVKEFTTEYGDCDGVFAEAAHVFKVSLKQHRGGAHPIEARGAVARYDAADDAMTLWSSTQTPHKVRNALAELFDLEDHRMRVIVPDVGGGFGAKHVVYPEEIIVAAAARILDRPVKWFEDRREHFLAAIQERDQYWEIEAATDGEGRLLALRGTVIHDQGAFSLMGINVPYNASIAVPGPYVIPNYRIHVTVVETNKVGTVPVRGAGYPEGNFAMERILDLAARELGLDRAEIRRRNFIRPEQMPYEFPMKTREGTPVIYDSGDYPLCQARALEAANYAGFGERRAKAREEGRHLGIGIANMVKVTGRGPFETGKVHVGRSGRVTVFTGAMAMGQGTKTTLAQICAEQLGLEPADITVIAGDTATVPHGIGGFGSRQLVTAGSSVHLAARQVREKALRVAAHMLSTAEQDLVLEGGAIRTDAGPSPSVTLGDIARALSGVKGYRVPRDVTPGLEASVDFKPSDVTYGNAAHVVEVEVDTGTGGVKILRYIVVNDSGRLINRMIVDGQIQGAVAHGIGNALFEWMGYDENAQPVITTFADYLLPTATEVPNIEIIHNETPTTLNPLGVKGVGEAGIIPAAAAIIAAVEHALEPFGVTITETPVSPARLVELMEGWPSET